MSADDTNGVLQALAVLLEARATVAAPLDGRGASFEATSHVPSRIASAVVAIILGYRLVRDGGDTHTDQQIVLHACAALAALASAPEGCRAVFAAGASDALLYTAWRFGDSHAVATHVCKAFGSAARWMHADSVRRPFSRGSAATFVLHLLQQHPQRAAVQSAGIDALGSIALLGSAPALGDAARAIGVIRCATLRFDARAVVTDEDGHRVPVDDARAVVSAGWRSLSLFERSIASLAPLCMTTQADLAGALVDGKQCTGAAVLWLAAHGSDSELRAAAAAASASSDIQWQSAVSIAACAGRVAAVDVLLPRCSGDSAVPEALRIAAARGDLALLEHMLERWDADPAGFDGSPLVLAAEHGQLSVLKRLLLKEEVSPAASEGAALWAAAGNGHLAVLERLLADPRVDPSCRCNAAVRAASQHGRVDVVMRLLQDERVDPGAGGQAALALAARECHIGVMHALLEDPRVDPEAYLTSYLKLPTKPLGQVPQLALLRRPSVVRALLANPAGAAERFRLPAAFCCDEMRGSAAAAWHRRRAAVLARSVPLL